MDVYIPDQTTTLFPTNTLEKQPDWRTSCSKEIKASSLIGPKFAKVSGNPIFSLVKNST